MEKADELWILMSVAQEFKEQRAHVIMTSIQFNFLFSRGQNI